jgi:cholesterol transport system auxiliary component
MPALLALLLTGLLSACGKPPMLVQQYLPDYPAPAAASRTPVPEALKVEQFSVAQAFNTQNMVYQPRPYTAAVYHYSRWRANPGYLVTDYLLRDLREARRFSGVFGPNSSAKYRFRLEGGVEEFLELDEPDGWQAVLAITVTLLDVNQEQLPQRVVLQKSYRAAVPMPEKTPQGLARAMSGALEQVSGQVIGDLADAARRRVAGQEAGGGAAKFR